MTLEELPEELRVRPGDIPLYIQDALRFVAHRDAPQATPADRKVT